MATWLIIANTAKALIYDITHPAPADRDPTQPHQPVLVKKLDHPEGRLKGTDLVSDGSGHFVSRGSSGSGKYEPKHDPRENEATHFAHEIADFLSHAHNQQRFQHLILCAGPHFHHVLDESLPESLKTLVQQHIQKDYAALPQTELADIVKRIYHHETL